MGKNQLTFAPPSFQKMLERLNVNDGSLEAGVVDAFNAMTEVIQPAIEENIKKHKRSGMTERALVKKPEIERSGNTYSVEYGYEMKEGVAAIFLELGTPRMKPMPTLRPAISGNRHKIRRLQKEAIMNMKRMK